MNILIVDDHQLIRSGLRDLLHSKYSDISTSEADTGSLALELVDGRSFDLAIVDLFLPGEAAFVFIRKLCDKRPELPVLVLSASEDGAHIRKCIDLGAIGFVMKSAPQADLIKAIDITLAGGVYIPIDLSQQGVNHLQSALNLADVTSKLTDRQLEILCMVAEGKTNKEIARVCKVADNTIKAHVSAILKALELSNRTQIGILGQKLGLVNTAQQLLSSSTHTL